MVFWDQVQKDMRKVVGINDGDNVRVAVAKYQLMSYLQTNGSGSKYCV